ncbi:hypothetical protein [Chitinophaga niabensis]|uniref:Uncharacterized protein n=1 Tax=Chitinophaga niabensis TaxID=536979 RepID=A0A1N6D0G3_9BACT|nr:hypothetical protein [Chitinophaga niabensis]SIN64300.1 hypothetical protein SAMN04488055_0038 [Chitinophaga niabensis]
MIHLTDTEIQEYVLDRNACSTQIIAHMQSCDTCKEAAAAYEILFAGIRAQPDAVFDFELSELVLEKIQVPERTRKPVPVLTILLSILCAGGSYFFRNDIAHLFSGIPPLLLYFIIISTGAVALFLLADMYKGYQQKMMQLDRY